MPDFTPTPDQMAAALQNNPQNQQASGMMDQYNQQMNQMGQSPMNQAMQGPMNPAQAGGMNAMMNQMSQAHNPIGGGMLGTPPPPPPSFHPPSATMGRINPALQNAMPQGMTSGMQAPNVSGQMPPNPAMRSNLGQQLGGQGLNQQSPLMGPAQAY